MTTTPVASKQHTATGYICQLVNRGLDCMQLAVLAMDKVPVTDYQDNPTKFKADMRAMAEMLKQAGL